jgi:hypothetical protein
VLRFRLRPVARHANHDVKWVMQYPAGKEFKWVMQYPAGKEC